ncbi:hypothetical protein AB1N83_011823 [Pleurotus pulmonarius]
MGSNVESGWYVLYGHMLFLSYPSTSALHAIPITADGDCPISGHQQVPGISTASRCTVIERHKAHLRAKFHHHSAHPIGAVLAVAKPQSTNIS